MTEIKNLKVLIVDDHSLTREVVADVMRERNVTNLKLVGDGASARNALLEAYSEGDPFDVVYLDHYLPHLEGLEILRQFRARPEFNSTAFIILTSESEQNMVLLAAKTGANGYLIKPVTKQAISKKLTDVAGWIEKTMGKN